MYISFDIFIAVNIHIMGFGLRHPHYLIGNHLPDYAATIMKTKTVCSSETL
jgi:hypothetical protein